MTRDTRTIDERLTPRSQALIASNIRGVFRDHESNDLSNASYNFIIQKMSFIAHYNRGGFASTYSDLRLLARALQTSEYSDDTEHMTRWACELTRRSEHNCAALIHCIIRIAREESDQTDRYFADLERNEALASAQSIADRYGVTIGPRS